jgi:hypothetical protein
MSCSIDGALRKTGGQALVEAAVLIPVLFMLMLLLSQPAILLYNLMVMEGAAAEGCRLLATRTDVAAYSEEKYLGYVKRRLAAIPPVDIFHAHVGEGAWDISLEGGEDSGEVTVRIVNHARPLPLIGAGATMLGLCNADGYFEQRVETTMPTQPSWVWSNSHGAPGDWTSR